ncbi:unnamed protein product [Durusdinium trenchii]|uniref:Uncharacterized protein n=1 Tax=Durusdinium trenchii TaxID=1381693 RepID=A0ABP0KWV1_9DINO
MLKMNILCDPIRCQQASQNWGTCQWKTFDFFGGALCLRQAWKMICSAAKRRWGIDSGLTFDFNVELNRACIRLHKEQWGECCCFTDILNMVTPASTGIDKWKPSVLKMNKTAYCGVHKKMCNISFEANDVALVGAPCVLFSLYGLGEGFTNKVKSRCQKASIKFQKKVHLSLHENVPGYDKEFLEQNLATHKIQTVLLDPRCSDIPTTGAKSGIWTSSEPSSLASAYTICQPIAKNAHAQRPVIQNFRV